MIQCECNKDVSLQVQSLGLFQPGEVEQSPGKSSFLRRIDSVESSGKSQTTLDELLLDDVAV